MMKSLNQLVINFLDYEDDILSDEIRLTVANFMKDTYDASYYMNNQSLVFNTGVPSYFKNVIEEFVEDNFVVDDTDFIFYNDINLCVLNFDLRVDSDGQVISKKDDEEGVSVDDCDLKMLENDIELLRKVIRDHIQEHNSELDEVDDKFSKQGNERTLRVSLLNTDYEDLDLTDLYDFLKDNVNVNCCYIDDTCDSIVSRDWLVIKFSNGIVHDFRIIIKDFLESEGFIVKSIESNGDSLEFMIQHNLDKINDELLDDVVDDDLKFNNLVKETYEEYWSFDSSWLWDTFYAIINSGGADNKDVLNGFVLMTIIKDYYNLFKGDCHPEIEEFVKKLYYGHDITLEDGEDILYKEALKRMS